MPCLPPWYPCTSASDPGIDFIGTELRHKCIFTGFVGLAMYCVNQKLLVLLCVRLLKTHYGTNLMRPFWHLAEYVICYIPHGNIRCFSLESGSKEIGSQNISSHFYTLWSIEKNYSSWSMIFGFVGSEVLVVKKRLFPPWDASVWVCSATQSCLILCVPMDCSTPGFPILHYLPEFAQTHFHWVSDAIKSSYPLSPFLLPSVFPSIRVFSNESSLCIRWPKHWSFSFSISSSNEYSGLISFRIA